MNYWVGIFINVMKGLMYVVIFGMFVWIVYITAKEYIQAEQKRLNKK